MQFCQLKQFSRQKSDDWIWSEIATQNSYFGFAVFLQIAVSILQIFFIQKEKKKDLPLKKNKQIPTNEIQTNYFSF